MIVVDSLYNLLSKGNFTNTAFESSSALGLIESSGSPVVAGVEVGCGLVGTGRPRESGKEAVFILKLFYTGFL